MQRRSFLSALASCFPAAALPNLTPHLHAQASPPSQTNLHIASWNNDPIYPMPFSSLLFRVSSQESGGGLFLIEHRNMLPGGPVLHMHLNQEELFYVEDGSVEFRVGEQTIQLKAGESVLAPRRVPHTFSALPGTPARMLIAFTPAGRMEEFFRESETNRALQRDPAFFRKCEMEMLGPNPFAKAGA